MPPKLKNCGRICNFTGQYKFLSNFFYSNIEYGGTIYPTAEHLYQACKTTDKRTREYTADAYSPLEAKSIGRNVVLRGDWEGVKDGMMLIVVKLKFLQNDELKAKLLETGNKRLEEGNYWHDNYWGNCTCQKCINKLGKNQLGKTLMKVRILCRQNVK